MTTSENLKTPSEWERIEGVRVLDADGWRADGLAWEFPLTLDEFWARASVSTIEMRVR